MIASVKGTRDLLSARDARVEPRRGVGARGLLALRVRRDPDAGAGVHGTLRAERRGSRRTSSTRRCTRSRTAAAAPVTMRPEATAGIARAYVEHTLAQAGRPWKLYCIGPQFRYERPQKGRYREFRQIDAEVLGPADAATDAELLVLLFDFLGRPGSRDSRFRSIRWARKPRDRHTSGRQGVFFFE